MSALLEIPALRSEADTNPSHFPLGLEQDVESNLVRLPAKEPWRVHLKAQAETAMARFGSMSFLLKIARFLPSLYDYSEKGRIDEAIDTVIEKFEDWLSRGELSVCRTMLTQLDVARLDPSISLSILSMTLVEKQQLGVARENVVAAVRSKLVADYGPNEANDNLKGLE